MCYQLGRAKRKKKKKKKKKKRLGTCAKSHPGICSLLIHSIVCNNSVSGQCKP